MITRSSSAEHVIFIIQFFSERASDGCSFIFHITKNRHSILRNTDSCISQLKNQIKGPFTNTPSLASLTSIEFKSHFEFLIFSSDSIVLRISSGVT